MTTKEMKSLSFDEGITTYEIVDITARSGLNNKQDTITDLTTIRNGANLGATALQSISSSDVTTALGYTPVANSTLANYELIAKNINVLSSSGTIVLTDNSINSIIPTGTITFTLPTITDATKFHQILVQINMSTVVSINVGTTNYFNKQAPDMSNIGKYDLIFEYDKANQYWVCGAIEKGAES